jgi:hypothetical protein
MQELETKTVAAGTIKEVRPGVLESLWPFSIAVECRREAVKGARKKLGSLVGCLRRATVFL